MVKLFILLSFCVFAFGCLKPTPIDKSKLAAASGSKSNDVSAYDGCVNGKSVGLGSANIEFVFPADASFISVFRNNTLIAVVTDKTKGSVNDSGLVPGQSYVYTCQATRTVNGVQVSLMGSKSQTITPQPQLSSAQILSAKNAISPYDSQLQIKWKKSSPLDSDVSVGGYTIFKVVGGKQIALRDISTCPLDPTDSTFTTCQVNLTLNDGLSSGVLYTLMVQAFDQSGYYELNSTKLQAITYSGVLSSTIISGQQVSITYPSMANADELNVYCSVDGGVPYVQAVVDNSIIATNPSLATSLILGSGTSSIFSTKALLYNAPLLTGHSYECWVNAVFGTNNKDFNLAKTSFMPLGKLNSLSFNKSPAQSTEPIVAGLIPTNLLPRVNLLDDSTPSNILLGGTDANDRVYLSLLDSNNQPVLTDSLFGNPSLAAASGTASFTNLSIAKAGTYRLKARATSTIGQEFTVISAPFTVIAGAMHTGNSSLNLLSNCPPSVIAWSAEVPSNINYGSIVECGNYLKYVVTLRDQYSNIIYNSAPLLTTNYNQADTTHPDSVSIPLSLVDGIGSYTFNVSSIRATTNSAGQNAIRLQNTSYNDAIVSQFTVSPASPVSALFENTNLTSAAGVAVSGIAVRIVDYFNNLVPDYSGTVTVDGLQKLSGGVGAIMTNTTKAVSSGRAVFPGDSSGLKIDRVGVYKVSASVYPGFLTYRTPQLPESSAQITINAGNPVDGTKTISRLTLHNSSFDYIPNSTPSVGAKNTNVALAANGQATAQLEVFLKDENGNPIAAGHVVGIQSTFAGKDTITGTSSCSWSAQVYNCLSDSNGKVNFFISSSFSSDRSENSNFQTSGSPAVDYTLIADGATAITSTLRVAAFSVVDSSQTNTKVIINDITTIKADGVTAKRFVASLSDKTSLSIFGSKPNCSAFGYGTGSGPASYGNTCTCDYSNESGQAQCDLKSTISEFKYPQITSNSVDVQFTKPQPPSYTGTEFSPGAGYASVQFTSGGVDLQAVIELTSSAFRANTTAALGSLFQSFTILNPNHYDSYQNGVSVAPEFSFEVVVSNSCSGSYTYTLADDQNKTYSQIIIPTIATDREVTFRVRCSFGNTCSPVVSPSLSTSSTVTGTFVTSSQFVNGGQSRTFKVMYDIPACTATKNSILHGSRIIIQQRKATKTQLYIPLYSNEAGYALNAIDYLRTTSTTIAEGATASFVSTLVYPDKYVELGGATRTHSFNAWQFKKANFTYSSLGNGLDGDGAKISFTNEISGNNASSSTGNLTLDLIDVTNCIDCTSIPRTYSSNQKVTDVGSRGIHPLDRTNGNFVINPAELPPSSYDPDVNSHSNVIVVCNKQSVNCIQDGKTYGMGLIKPTTGGATGFSVQKSGLWVNLQNLSRGLVLRKVGHSTSATSQTTLASYYLTLSSVGQLFSASDYSLKSLSIEIYAGLSTTQSGDSDLEIYYSTTNNASTFKFAQDSTFASDNVSYDSAGASNIGSMFDYQSVPWNSSSTNQPPQYYKADSKELMSNNFSNVSFNFNIGLKTQSPGKLLYGSPFIGVQFGQSQ